MKIKVTEAQFKLINEEKEMGERSRSLAFSRRKRLYPEPARRYAANRFRYEDRIEEGDKPLNDKQVKSIEDLNKDAKFLTCDNCRKKFTQVTYKKKKSLPICPWCGTHNNKYK
jgi:rubrerythrin